MAVPIWEMIVPAVMKSLRTVAGVNRSPLTGGVLPGIFGAARSRSIPARSFFTAAEFSFNPARQKAASVSRKAGLTFQKVAATWLRTALSVMGAVFLLTTKHTKGTK